MRPTLFVRCVWCLVLALLSLTSTPSCYGHQNSSGHAFTDAEADFKDHVKEKLTKLFEKSPEDLTRVLFFLDDNDKNYQNSDIVSSPYWRSFKAIINDEMAFKKYAQRLVADTKTVENNPRFLKVMHDIYENAMVPTDTPLQAYQDFDWSLLGDVKQMKALGFAGLARVWTIIPTETKAIIIELLPHITQKNPALITAFGESVDLASKTGGHIAMIGLATAYLGYEALMDIRRWWNGDISGKRCAKNVVDATITTAAGIGGTIWGATMGSVFGPFGTFFGGVFGGMLSSSVARVLVDRLTQRLFDLPKSEALENAYNYLGVRHTAPNTEVNAAFHRLCRKHHPDQGGDAEEFMILQSYMSIIKLARKEL